MEVANVLNNGKASKVGIDIIIAFGVIGIVFMMIVPIPGFILDFLLTLNLSLSIAVILTAIYIKKVLDFSSFPSLLLLLTIFGLGLNISTTRQILLLGPAMRIQLIRAFGDFVVGGNYVVGFIIFLILVIIQFIVISKGATRVSEVAARFRLDSTPGLQMAIAGDLDAGLIDRNEATRRRKELENANEFYGAMDGASKFVQGNIIAAFIINLINIIGGLIIGVAMRGEAIGAAVKTYTLFTVGDGLLSQLPSLLIATAMGILVTRSVSDEALSENLVRQVTSIPKVMYISGGLLIIIPLITPLPKIQVMGIGLLFVTMGYLTQRSLKKKVSAEKELKTQQIADEEIKRGPEDVVQLTKIEPIILEFGYSLVPIFDPKMGGTVLERITMLRKTFALNSGLLVPPIRIRDNVGLSPEEYSIKIKDVSVDKFKLKTGHLLAINTGLVENEIEGSESYDPIYHVPAKWILEKDKEKAETLGYTVVDAPTIIITHLQAIIKKYSSEIFSRTELKSMFENSRSDSPSVDELLKSWGDVKTRSRYPIGVVHKVFCNLLEENLPIKDVATIADAIVDFSNSGEGENPNAYSLTEYVRSKMSLIITNNAKHDDGKLYIVTVSPDLEEMIRNNMEITTEGYFLQISPDVRQKIIAKFKEAAMDIQAKGYHAVIICDPYIRGLVWQILKNIIKNLTVISYNEVVEGVEIFALRTVKLMDE